MKAFANFFVIGLKLFFRDWQSVFWTFLFPPFMLFLFGQMYGNERQEIFEGLGFVDLFVPGLISIGILATALFYIGASIAEYRERGILRKFRVTPLRPTLFISAHIFTTYCIMILNMTLLVILGIFFYSIRVEGTYLLIFIVVTFATFSFFAMAFVIASLASTARAANAVAMALFMPMMVLSGAIFPLEFFSKSFQTIGKFIPLTYVVDLLRNVWSGEGLIDNWANLTILTGCLVTGLLISAVTFKWG